MKKVVSASGYVALAPADGTSAVSYRLNVPCAAIHTTAKSSAGVWTPATLQASVLKSDGDIQSLITTDAQMSSNGLTLQFAIEQGGWAYETISIAIVHRIQADWMDYSNGVKFRLLKGSVVLDEVVLGVVCNGDVGPMGKSNRLPYSAGFYDSSQRYTATDQVAPYVYYSEGNTYYVMNKSVTVAGLNPATDYALNGSNATWIPLTNLKNAFVEILMANFAKLASAVFKDQYMFSQQGIDASGNATSDYSSFGTDAFSPNIMLDFLTGKSKFNDTEVTGTINANQGCIGDLLIRGNQLIGIKNGVEKVGITVDDIPALSAMYQSTILAGTEIIYSSDIYYYSSGGSKLSGYTDKSFVLPVPAEIVLDTSSQYSINITDGSFTGTVYVSHDVYVDGVRYGTHAINRTYPAGNVTIRLIWQVTPGQYDSTFVGSFDYDSRSMSYRIAPSKTLQGPNGIISMFSQSDYFYTREGWGTEIRQGNGGIRVVNGVAQVMRNGTWANL